MKNLSRPLAGVVLLIAIGLGIGLTVLLENAAAPAIQANRDALRNQMFRGVIPMESYDNQPLQHPLTLPDRTASSVVHDGFLATQGGQPRAIIFRSVGQGYAGPLELLIGVSVEGRLMGIKVLKHTETPGLGGRIVSVPQWLNGLLGKSLTDPDEASWRLKQDGGAFDQIARATITSRAAMETIRETLRYFDAEKNRLLPHATGEQP
ncbi:RnfABCDGE type electron transport complex subunit G [Pseudomonas sp. DWP3-1-2]|uniref:RnfABCDGE type electron transport complex subunit G n=1 Tax=Pseudomonas sp. DWP3-1-2 TaxID=2804645 RepID=UPI003CF9C560